MRVMPWRGRHVNILRVIRVGQLDVLSALRLRQLLLLWFNSPRLANQRVALDIFQLDLLLGIRP